MHAALFDEILDTVADATNNWVEIFDNESNSNGWKLNEENAQRSKLRADARKWMMTRMKPKKYGDRIRQDVSGGLTI